MRGDKKNKGFRREIVYVCHWDLVCIWLSQSGHVDDEESKNKLTNSIFAFSRGFIVQAANILERFTHGRLL